MVLLSLLGGFRKENVKKSVDEKKIALSSSQFLLLFCYEKEDAVTRLMIKKYGYEINELLGYLDLFTYYSKEVFESWGKNFRGQLVLASQDFSKVNNEDEMFSGMKKLGESYGVKKYPAIIIVNPENTTNCIVHEISIPKGKNIEESADLLFNEYFKKMLEFLNDSETRNIPFTDLGRLIEKKFGNIAEYIESKVQMEIKLIDSFDKLRDFYNTKKKYYKKTNIEHYAIGISTSSFNKRFFEDDVKFTRDEIICMSIYLGLSVDETNDFILLNNVDDKLLDSNSLKDSLFIRLLGKNDQDITYIRISEMLKEENRGKLRFKEGSINSYKVTGIPRRGPDSDKIVEIYEYQTKKNASREFLDENPDYKIVTIEIL